MNSSQDKINGFLAHLEHVRGYAKRTRVAYGTDLQQYIEYLADQGLLLAFPCNLRNDIKAYLDKLEGRGMSPATIGRKLAALRTFFRWLVKIGEVQGNPVIGIHPPQNKRAPPKIITERQVRTLVEMADRPHVWGRRDRAILELLSLAGMKVGELVALNWSDVNLDERNVQIKGRGSQDRSRVLYYSTQCTLGLYMKDLDIFQLRFKERQAVFLNRSGHRLTARSIGRIVEKYAKRAGLPKWVSPQALRHSFASHALDRGTNIEDIRVILGHQSVETTKIYTKMREKGSASVNSGS